MKILAMDQSSSRSGWAVLDDGAPIKFGFVDHAKESDVSERIKHMFLDLAKVIDECQADELVVEAAQQQANPKAMAILSQLQGCLIGKAYCSDLAVTSLMPCEWRKVLHFQQGAGVKRPELKAQSIKYVKENFGLDVSEDEAEAICIGRAEYLRLKS